MDFSEGGSWENVDMTTPYLENRYTEGLVKSFLDVIVLAMLNGTPVHGYKIISDLHMTFGVLLSPGTLYPLLYNLEKENLVEVENMKRKKMYSLTQKGRRKVSMINGLYKKNSDKIFSFIEKRMTNTLL